MQYGTVLTGQVTMFSLTCSCVPLDTVLLQVNELVHAQELLSNLQLRANAALQQHLKCAKPLGSHTKVLGPQE